jgi:prolyl-tRNA editing enzyme YbaK/EbsC (Cys-tRNA(Pro) deacylase)
MTLLLTFTPDELVSWLTTLGIETRLLRPGVPMPTVPLAARAIGVDERQILKTLLFRDRAGSLVRVIASGPSRIDLDLLSQLAALDRPKLARPELVLEATGWPAGGVAPVGSRISLPTFVDRGVLDWPRVFGGGGTEDTLIELAPADIVALNLAEVATLTNPS